MRIEPQELDLLIDIYKHLYAVGARPDLAAALLRVINRLSTQNDTYGCTVWLELTQERVEQDIPYKLVYEMRYGSWWDTMDCQCRWETEFTSTERKHAERLFRLAHRWHLSGGVPKRVKMSSADFDLWQKLGKFCESR